MEIAEQRDLFFCILCGCLSEKNKEAGHKQMNNRGVLERELTCMFTRKVNIPFSAATYISKGSVKIIINRRLY